MNLLKMCGLQIWLCLFTFWPISLKQLNSLTTIVTLSWRIPFWFERSRVQFPAPARVWFLFCCCCVFTFLAKTLFLSQHFAISFAILIHLVYLTYCKICDLLYGYKNTDRASLMLTKWFNEIVAKYTCRIWMGFWLFLTKNL